MTERYIKTLKNKICKYYKMGILTNEIEQLK